MDARFIWGARKLELAVPHCDFYRKFLVALEQLGKEDFRFVELPSENKLSNESPVGRALLGHRRNETVSVQVPRGPARKLKITKIDVGVK